MYRWRDVPVGTMTMIDWTCYSCIIKTKRMVLIRSDESSGNFMKGICDLMSSGERPQTTCQYQ